MEKSSLYYKPPTDYLAQNLYDGANGFNEARSQLLKSSFNCLDEQKEAKLKKLYKCLFGNALPLNSEPCEKITSVKKCQKCHRKICFSLQNPNMVLCVKISRMKLNKSQSGTDRKNIFNMNFLRKPSLPFIDLTKLYNQHVPEKLIADIHSNIFKPFINVYYNHDYHCTDTKARIPTYNYKILSAQNLRKPTNGFNDNCVRKTIHNNSGAEKPLKTKIPVYDKDRHNTKTSRKPTMTIDYETQTKKPHKTNNIPVYNGDKHSVQKLHKLDMPAYDYNGHKVHKPRKNKRDYDYEIRGTDKLHKPASNHRVQRLRKPMLDYDYNNHSTEKPRKVKLCYDYDVPGTAESHKPTLSYDEDKKGLDKSRKTTHGFDYDNHGIKKPRKPSMPAFNYDNHNVHYSSKNHKGKITKLNQDKVQKPKENFEDVADVSGIEDALQKLLQRIEADNNFHLVQEIHYRNSSTDAPYLKYYIVRRNENSETTEGFECPSECCLCEKSERNDIEDILRTKANERKNQSFTKANRTTAKTTHTSRHDEKERRSEYFQPTSEIYMIHVAKDQQPQNTERRPKNITKETQKIINNNQRYLESNMAPETGTHKRKYPTSYNVNRCIHMSNQDEAFCQIDKDQQQHFHRAEVTHAHQRHSTRSKSTSPVAHCPNMSVPHYMGRNQQQKMPLKSILKSYELAKPFMVDDRSHIPRMHCDKHYNQMAINEVLCPQHGVSARNNTIDITNNENMTMKYENVDYNTEPQKLIPNIIFNADLQLNDEIKIKSKSQFLSEPTLQHKFVEDHMHEKCDQKQYVEYHVVEKQREIHDNNNYMQQRLEIRNPEDFIQENHEQKVNDYTVVKSRTIIQSENPLGVEMINPAKRSVHESYLKDPPVSIKINNKSYTKVPNNKNNFSKSYTKVSIKNNDRNFEQNHENCQGFNLQNEGMTSETYDGETNLKNENKTSNKDFEEKCKKYKRPLKSYRRKLDLSELKQKVLEASLTEAQIKYEQDMIRLQRLDNIHSGALLKPVKQVPQIIPTLATPNNELNINRNESKLLVNSQVNNYKARDNSQTVNYYVNKPKKEKDDKTHNRMKSIRKKRAEKKDFAMTVHTNINVKDNGTNPDSPTIHEEKSQSTIDTSLNAINTIKESVNRARACLENSEQVNINAEKYKSKILMPSKWEQRKNQALLNKRLNPEDS